MKQGSAQLCFLLCFYPSCRSPANECRRCDVRLYLSRRMPQLLQYKPSSFLSQLIHIDIYHSHGRFSKHGEGIGIKRDQRHVFRNAKSGTMIAPAYFWFSPKTTIFSIKPDSVNLPSMTSGLMYFPNDVLNKFFNLPVILT